MIKFPLRYPGGKSRAVETIARLIPDYELESTASNMWFSTSDAVATEKCKTLI